MKTEAHSEPYLSICIPTYNRAARLATCLNSIVSQLPQDKSIEIWISDNASTDNTREIAQEYTQNYPFIHYWRNSENIGGDRNFVKALQLGNGKFIKLQGDDDYYLPGTIDVMLNALKQNEDCGLLFINMRGRSSAVRRGKGHSAYLRETTMLSGHISVIVFQRKDLMLCKDWNRFLETGLNHIYLQYALLNINPQFCVLDCLLFNPGSEPSEGYSAGIVFIENYQTILRHFVGNGLSEEDYEYECKTTLYKDLIPNIPLFLKLGKPGYFNDFREVYMRNYKDKPYYEEGLAMIDAVLPLSR